MLKIVAYSKYFLFKQHIHAITAKQLVVIRYIDHSFLLFSVLEGIVHLIGGCVCSSDSHLGLKAREK